MRKLSWSLLRLGLVVFTLITVVRARPVPSVKACVVCKFNGRVWFCMPVPHGYIFCQVDDNGRGCSAGKGSC